MYKDYIIIVDGLTVGVVALTPDDVKILLNDNDIQVREV